MLVPNLVYTLPTVNKDYFLYLCNPNFMPRQFGLAQTILTPHFIHEGQFICGHRVKGADALKLFLEYKNIVMTTKVIDFDTTVGATPEFIDWCVRYFKTLKIIEESVKQRLGSQLPLLPRARRAKGKQVLDFDQMSFPFMIWLPFHSD